MASMQLDGPYPLSFDHIDKVVARGRPGVFAVGYGGDGNVFYVNYIGRSDDDVRTRLLELIGSDRAFKYKSFDTAKEAFLRECELFHAFRPPGNRLHPSRPKLSDWTCPKCWSLGDR